MFDLWGGGSDPLFYREGTFVSNPSLGQMKYSQSCLQRRKISAGLKRRVGRKKNATDFVALWILPQCPTHPWYHTTLNRDFIFWDFISHQLLREANPLNFQQPWAERRITDNPSLREGVPKLLKASECMVAFLISDNLDTLFLAFWTETWVTFGVRFVRH